MSANATIEVSPHAGIENFMNTRKFWPLDFDMEGEIYDNPAWDLPGRRPTRGSDRIHARKAGRNTVSSTEQANPV